MAGTFLYGSSVKSYPGKFTNWVFWTYFVTILWGLLFGYNLGVSGGVSSMDSFLKNFFPEVYQQEKNIKPWDDQTLTLFTSSLYLAVLVASVFAPTVIRLLGRRTTMICAGVLILGGAELNDFALNVRMLIVGRILIDLGIGCANKSLSIYISEVDPYKHIGVLNMMFKFTITVGIFVANVINYNYVEEENGEGWRYSLRFPTILALIIICSASSLPRLPSFFMEHGLDGKAKTKLIEIRGITYVNEEFEDLVTASECSKAVKHPWISLLKRRYRPQLTFAIAIPFFQQLTGMNVIVFYAPILFKTIGFGVNASFMSTMITGGCHAITTLVSIFTVDKFDRRTLFLVGGIQMFIGQIFVAIACKFGLDGNPEMLPKYATVAVWGICVYMTGFAWSWSPLGWLVPSEIFSLEVRSAAQSINISMNMILTFAIMQIFTIMLYHIKFGLFIFFACFVIVMNIFIYSLLSETKGVSIEEMYVVWQSHSYWKKFVEPDAEVKTTNDEC
ncbi:MFS transporter [Vigna unguiculata]|uniref:MFS transporter n=1 Tax=Vigna unguiculata TaxID=3917 RepID=A0A4D6KIA6_VIGUN|nr:MFS transporter [Vigna unguiculata]